MKAILKIEDPENMAATLTVRVTIRELVYIEKAIRTDTVPASAFATILRGIIARARQEFGEEYKVGDA